MRRISLLLPLLSFALLAVAAPASAIQPTRFEVVEPIDVVYPCGLTETGVRYRSYTTFYDQDGNEVRTVQQVTFDAVITNPETGETFSDRGHATVIHKLDFSTGFALLGIVYNIRVPQEGLLLLDVGRLVANADFNTVFQSAQALGFFDIDAAVCAALD